MTRLDLHNHLERTFVECLELAGSKSRDYAGDGDPFANFRLPEQLGLCSIERGILVRICDKISRLSTLLTSDRPRSVVDETVADTIKDGINYLAILGGYLAEKAAAAEGSAFPEEIDQQCPHPVEAEWT